MFNVERKTIRVDIDNTQDLAAYDKILNDPTCTILREIKEKLTERDMGEEGRIIGIRDRLLLIVTYEKREAII